MLCISNQNKSVVPINTFYSKKHLVNQGIHTHEHTHTQLILIIYNSTNTELVITEPYFPGEIQS